MMTDTEVHIYNRRNLQHVFIGDTYAGIYSPKERTVRVRESLRSRENDIKTGFMRLNGVPVKVLAGDDELAQAVPLIEFPDEVKSLMTPELGDKTPAVIAWARENFPAAEFVRRYGDAFAAPEPVVEAPVEAVQLESSEAESESLQSVAEKPMETSDVEQAPEKTEAIEESPQAEKPKSGRKKKSAGN